MNYSLHYGLTKVDNRSYQREVSPVPMADQDARTMAEIAHAEGFQVEAIRIDEEATYDTFQKDFLRIKDQLKAGDFFMFSYAGHGTQLEDRPGNEVAEDDKNGFDEGFCFYDGVMLDNRMAELLAELPLGCFFIAVIDCCHSGDLYKFLVFDQTKPETYVQDLVDSFQFTGVWLAAARERQLAVGDHKGGIFTQNVKQVWNEGQFSKNYVDFHHKVRRLSPPNSTPRCKPLGIEGTAFIEKGIPFKTSSIPSS
ncbi:MAG: caspase family protein [Bacteroidota bacterium]